MGTYEYAGSKDFHGSHRCGKAHASGSQCYAPTGHIVQHAGLGCKVISGLQFRDSQVLVEQGLRLVLVVVRDIEVLMVVRLGGQQ